MIELHMTQGEFDQLRIEELDDYGVAVMSRGNGVRVSMPSRGWEEVEARALLEGLGALSNKIHESLSESGYYA
jgi:hypothetical protein